MKKKEIIEFASQIPGWMTEGELSFLVDMAGNERRPVRYVEVGAFRGRSASAIYLSLPKDSEFIAVDKYRDYIEIYQKPPDPKVSMKENMEKCHKLRPDIKFTLLEMDSLEACQEFADESLDYVFIDADHEYLPVLKDIRAWLPKVKFGGYLMGHDYKSDYNLGVVFAVNEVFPSFHKCESIWSHYKSFVPNDLALPNTEKWNLDVWDRKKGVLTATDSDFFPGLQLLVLSTRGRVPVAVADLGMTHPQRAWCEKYAVKVLPNKERLPVADWRYYIKPILIKNSPFNETLWVDSDCIFVGDPAPLYRIMKNHPLVVQHWDVDYKPNQDEAYASFNVERGSVVNCGVMGFDLCRDKNILDEWIGVVRRVCDDEKLRASVGCYDEGCFHLIVNKMGLQGVPERGWNRCVTPPSARSAGWFVRQMPSPQEGDVIWHFSGPKKPWFNWS